MDAARALADLTEISSQIEGAVLFAADGSLLASTFADDERGRRFADAARALLEAAAGLPGERTEAPLAQLEAASPEGDVFVVRDAERAVAAVTTPEPTAGLVFYDLKSCLRAAAADEGDGKPRPRARRTQTKPRAAAGKEAESEGAA